MRAPLASKLRTEFTKALKASCPELRPEKQNDGAGSRVFSWQCAPGVWCFVHLIISRYADEFDVELAWSTQDRFPDHVAPLPKDPITDVAGKKALRFPLTYLRNHEDPSVREKRWVLGVRPTFDGTVEASLAVEPVEIALSRIPSMIQDAIGRIEAEAMPYFRELPARL